MVRGGPIRRNRGQDNSLIELGESHIGQRNSIASKYESVYERSISCPAEYCNFVCETPD